MKTAVAMDRVFQTVPQHYVNFFGREIDKEGVKKFAESWTRVMPMTEEEYITAYRDLTYSDELAYTHIKKKYPKINQTRKVVKIIQSIPNVANVIDLGCGIGTDGLVLSALGYRVTCIEPNVNMCHFLKFRSEALGLPVTIINGTENDILKADIDVILFLEVIEHFYNPYTSLERISNLKPKYMLFSQSFGQHDVDAGGFPQHSDHSVTKIFRFLSEKLGYKKMHIYGMWFPLQLWALKNNPVDYITCSS